MALTAGTKLGPYEIQSPLGAGGSLRQMRRALSCPAIRLTPRALGTGSFASSINWLTAEQGHALRQAPDQQRLKGKRDRALLALLLACGLASSRGLNGLVAVEEGLPTIP